ncbi:retrotransposon protein, putative, ty1-copia subclass [Tanacetum coccineum]
MRKGSPVSSYVLKMRAIRQSRKFYNILVSNNKRAKLDLDSALLWHAYWTSSSKKPLRQLQHYVLLNSTDLMDFEKMPSLVFLEDGKGNLTKTSSERAQRLYLRQKHTMGEYMSQEFLDHLKDHGIIAHRTPPYTPKHNGVLERRNKTLLDMVRSMMSQTTLPNSFWDYAFETAAPILNMVPTKKVEKTPYKVWHGQAHKLSYLKVWGCETLVKRDTLTKPDKSTRKRRPIDRMCLYIDAEEHELGDLGKPANYKAALLDPESDKCANAENVEIQSHKDIQSLDLVLIFLLTGKTVGSKMALQKKTDMDGSYTQPYKAHSVAKANSNPIVVIRGNLLSYCNIKAIRLLKPYRIFMYYEFGKWMFKTTLPQCGYPLQKSKSQGASTPAELKRMQNVRIRLSCGSIMVSCYTDAGYLTDADDLKYQTGYVFVLNEGDADWTSTKQSIFATSSAEAEYIAAYDAFKETVWVRKFISGIGVVPTIEEPINMYCDNTGEIAIANESAITKGARHFHAKVHYLREVIEFCDIKLEKVHIEENLVDSFTKALAFPKHSEYTRNIGMLPVGSLIGTLLGKWNNSSGNDCRKTGTDNSSGNDCSKTGNDNSLGNDCIKTRNDNKSGNESSSRSRNECSYPGNESNNSWNDTDADGAYIKPSYDTKPMVEDYSNVTPDSSDMNSCKGTVCQHSGKDEDERVLLASLIKI